MILKVDFNSPLPLYAQIKDQILFNIASGTLSSGERLPSVRELSTSLRINPNTVIQAYRELERDGVVQTRKGQGSFIREGGAGMGTQRAADLLRDELKKIVSLAGQFGLEREEIKKLLIEILDDENMEIRDGRNSHV